MTKNYNIHSINEDILEAVNKCDCLHYLIDSATESAYSSTEDELGERKSSNDQEFDKLYNAEFDEALDLILDKIRQTHDKMEQEFEENSDQNEYVIDGQIMNPEWIIDGDYPYVCHAVDAWQCG